jgi:hypothetical protein
LTAGIGLVIAELFLVLMEEKPLRGGGGMKAVIGDS